MRINNNNSLLIIIFSFMLISKVQASRFLVFGGMRGWIGQKIVHILKEKDQEVYCAQSRLENREHIEKEILKIQPDYIINSAGITGKPTVNWCETHKEETIRANVLGLINLIDIAYMHNIHVTNFATGCIYQYDKDHPMYSGIGFTENEAPNFKGSFYSLTKVQAEQLIMHYPNVLNLRVRMPISKDLHAKSFIGKILGYKKLINIPNSMTILEDLLQLVPSMIERNLTGIYNFVNPGTISHHEIMELYKQYVDPNHHYEGFTIEEQNQMLKVPRSNCELSAQKLLQEFPGIPNIKDSVKKILQDIKKGNH